MSKVTKYTLLVIALPLLVNAQYYNKKYVKDLRHRLLISYFQEYGNLDLNLKPTKGLDNLQNENLLLSSSANLFSGILIQTNNSSLYLAGTNPQTEEDIDKHGKQNSKIVKIAMVFNSVYTSFRYLRNSGFYDKNYKNHPEFLNDSISYRRYSNSDLTWINFDINYYKNNRHFASGMPSYFGLRQLKSNISLATRFSYNKLAMDNKENSFFRDSISKQHTSLTLSKFQYEGVNFSLSPSFHLVALKKIFLSGELSLGADLGIVKSTFKNKIEPKFYSDLSLSQAKAVMGYHGDRFLTAVYYTFIAQSFKTNSFDVSTVYNNFGFIVGYRINIYKNLPWEKDI